MRFDQAFGGLLTGTRSVVLSALLRTGVPLTGRQVYALVSDECSLWSVQQELAALAELGLVSSVRVGRAIVHVINEDHYATPLLRRLADPMTVLQETVRDVVGTQADAVVVFGSIARGEAGPSSDVDLAVIAPGPWDGRVDLEDAVRNRLGNDCDVLVFTTDEFLRYRRSGEEPVVRDILTDGVVLMGSLSHVKAGVA